jgi:hypothetical protein
MTWAPPRRHPLSWVRLGLAGALVVACALAGLVARCDDMPGTPFVALVLLLVVQGGSALASFVASAIAAGKGDRPRMRCEAGIGLAMLLAIPLAAFALFSLSPSCAC